jgi:hypothetical protein
MMRDTAAKRYAYVAFLAMLILALGAIWYYKERMILTDASLVSFRRINLQDMESSQRRWGAFITELVPLVLSKLHAPLRVILVAYSLSFNLFYLAVMALLIFRWRLHALSLLMACYYLLFVSAGYFWTNNEIHQSIAYMFLSLGFSYTLCKAGIAGRWQYLAFIFLSGVAIFTHPLAVIAFIFVWVALWLHGTDWPYGKRQTFYFLGILVVWAIIKFTFSNSQPYDARRMYGLTHPSKDIILNAFNGKVALNWYKECVTNYWLPVLLSAAGIVIMFLKRKRLLAGWTILSGVGFIALVHCGFPDGHFLYYLEGEWQTMGLIAGFPIVFYLLPSLRSNWAVGLLSLLFLSRLYYIKLASPDFTYRIHYIECMNLYARKNRLTKVLVKASDSRFEQPLFMDWGLATESMTLSALAGDYPHITICALWPDHPERIPHGNKEMVWNFVTRPASALNPYYFSFDTTGPYVVVPFEQMANELK